jgi:predicted anti-sigma-YlaC factor YlaD
MNKHLTTDELVDRLYGVGASDHLANEHLESCGECWERFRQLRERRAMAAEPRPASYEFLAAQRRNIYARMGEAQPMGMKWVPALAAAVCLVAAGVFVYRPAQAPRPESTDAQLFSDVYSMEQSMEPLAASPIHALFEQDQQ